MSSDVCEYGGRQIMKWFFIATLYIALIISLYNGKAYLENYPHTNFPKKQWEAWISDAERGDELTTPTHRQWANVPRSLADPYVDSVYESHCLLVFCGTFYRLSNLSAIALALTSVMGLTACRKKQVVQGKSVLES